MQNELTEQNTVPEGLSEMELALTEDLYTAKDVARIRAILQSEQGGKCKLTDNPLTKPVLDHKHDADCFVRGVINSAANVYLGKVENLSVRYLNYWYKDGLPSALRELADYIEIGHDERFRHPQWIAKIRTAFNALKEPLKDAVLVELGVSTGTNAKERKELFNKAVLSRQYSYDELRGIIKGVQ
jgi:Recombination endonuclease VII